MWSPSTYILKIHIAFTKVCVLYVYLCFCRNNLKQVKHISLLCYHKVPRNLTLCHYFVLWHICVRAKCCAHFLRWKPNVTKCQLDRVQILSFWKFSKKKAQDREVSLALLTFAECWSCARRFWQGWEPTEKKDNDPVLKDLPIYWGRWSQIQCQRHGRLGGTVISLQGV